MSYVIPPKSLVLELERYLKAHKRVISYELLETDNYLNIEVSISKNIKIDIYFYRVMEVLNIEFRLLHLKGFSCYGICRTRIYQEVLTKSTFYGIIDLSASMVFDTKQDFNTKPTILLTEYEKGKAAALPTGND